MQTRWQRARADAPGFRRRDIAFGVLGGGVTVAVLAALGFPVETLAEVGIGVGGAIVAGVAYYAAPLAWAWSQAPMRMLTDEVMELRRAVEARAPAEASPSRQQVRLKVLDLERKGTALLKYNSIPTQLWEGWADEVGAFLIANVDVPGAAERFLQTTAPTIAETVQFQCLALHEIAAQLADAAV